MNQYLFDTNIVIKIWDDNPSLLQIIEKSEYVDYIITNDIALEISQKEITLDNGIPVFSKRFLSLAEHIINNDVYCGDPRFKDNRQVNQDENGNLYIVRGNKISYYDNSLISVCNYYSQYILITEDKKLYKSALLTLDKSRVLNYSEFINQLKELFII